MSAFVFPITNPITRFSQLSYLRDNMLQTRARLTREYNMGWDRENIGMEFKV